MMLHKPLWHEHPHVRSANQLSAGELWADRLKRGFGTWWFLGILNGIFFAWVIVDIISGNKIDPGLFYANLFLSWLAGQQGGALQIAANRGDRVSSEVALSTHQNSEDIKTLIQQNTDLTKQNAEMARQQTEMLNELRGLRQAVAAQADDSTPGGEG